MRHSVRVLILCEAMKRIDAETSDDYVLGYYSTNPDPTQRRRAIEIRLKKKDADLELIYPQRIHAETGRVSNVLLITHLPWLTAGLWRGERAHNSRGTTGFTTGTAFGPTGRIPQRETLR